MPVLGASLPQSMPIALNTKQAQLQINNWYPWLLIQSLTGRPITKSVQNLALTLESKSEHDANYIKLRASILFG